MMKRVHSLGRLIFCILAVPGCAKEYAGQEPGGTVSFSVSAFTDESVRTSLSGKDVVWQEGDRVAAICCDDLSGKSSVSYDIAPESIDGRNARFNVSTLSGMIPRYLVYPSAAGYGFSSDGLICVPVAEEMTGREGDAPEAGLYSVGLIENESVRMKNIMSLLKFEISSTDINRIKVSSNGGEPLSGNILFDPETLLPVKGGNPSVSIVPPADSSAFAPGTYYVPVPSVTLSAGLTVKFCRSDGDAARKSYDSEYAIARNRIIGMGKESEWDLDFKPSTLVMDIVFYDGTDTFFPFTDDPAALSAISCPAVKDVAGKGVVGPFYLVGHPGHKFFFCVQNTSGSKSYFISQGDYGMRLGGTPGDYIAFPAIPNSRLSKIYFEEGRSSSYYTVMTNPDSGPAEYLTASSVTINKNTTRTFTFDATQTAPGKSYRFCTAATNPSAMKRIELTYDEVD